MTHSVKEAFSQVKVTCTSTAQTESFIRIQCTCILGHTKQFIDKYHKETSRSVLGDVARKLNLRHTDNWRSKLVVRRSRVLHVY